MIIFFVIFVVSGESMLYIDSLRLQRSQAHVDGIYFCFSAITMPRPVDMILFKVLLETDERARQEQIIILIYRGTDLSISVKADDMSYRGEAEVCFSREDERKNK